MLITVFAATFFLCSCLSKDAGVPLGDPAPLLGGGVAPFLTGVDGGSVLSMYSGDMYGPKETLLRGLSPPGAAGDWLAARFFPLPADLGVFGVGGFDLGVKILKFPEDFRLELLASFLLGVNTLPGDFLGLASALAGGDLAAVRYFDPTGYSHLKDRSPRVNMSLWRSSVARLSAIFLLLTLVGRSSMEVMNTCWFSLTVTLQCSLATVGSCTRMSHPSALPR